MKIVKTFFHCYKLIVTLVCIFLFGTCYLGCQPISKETTKNEAEVTDPSLKPDEGTTKNNSYDLMWEFKIGGTGDINTPVIVGNNIVFSIDYGANYSMVYALDKKTNELQWHKSMDFRTLNHSVASGNMVFFTSNGVFAAIDAVTGETKWEYTPEEWGFLTPSICTEQIVIAVLERDQHTMHKDEIIAFDITTGEIKWRNRVNAALIMTKIPAIGHGMIYVGTSNWMGALDIETGKEVWNVPANLFYSHPLTNPGVNDEIVCFIIDGGHKLLALEMLTGEEKWQVELPETLSFSGSTPLLSNDYVYLRTFQKEGYLVVIDATTGEVLQEYDSESYRGAPVAQDEHFLYLHFYNRIHTLMKQNSKLEPVWSFRSRNSSYNRLLLEKDILYFGAGNTLYAIRNLIDPTDPLKKIP